MPQQTFTITAPNGRTLDVTGDLVPNEAELRDIFRAAGVDTGQPSQTVPQPQPDAPSGGVGTFARRVGSRLNPIAAAQAFGRMVIPENAARLMGAGDAEAEQYGPINTLRNMGQSQQQVFEQAKRAYDAGDYGSAAIKTFFGMMPVVGPDFNQMGDAMREGRAAEALGDATGLGLSLTAPQIVKSVAPAAGAVRNRVVAAADRGATDRMTKAMVPTIGPNKRRFGNMAADVAPRVVRETSAVTRSGLMDQVATKLDDASATLEAAYDAVPPTQMYATAPIKSGLELAIKNLSVSGVEPATRAARIASLRQAIKEVDGVGKVANLETLRRLRQSWDEGAKAIFTPDIAADALKTRGAGHGWADARSAVGDYIGSKHPELRPLNADVSLWIKAQDVLQAAEEIERVRPTVGRSIMARGLGAATGAAGAGVPGAITGAVVGPLVERAMANAAPAVKITLARQMARLADALRAGNQAKAATLMGSINRLVPAGGMATSATSPAVLPAAASTDPARSPQAGRMPR